MGQSVRYALGRVRGYIAALCFPLALLVPQAAVADGGFLQARMAMPAPKGAQQICQTYRWACAAQRARTLNSSAELALVLDVNTKVNTTTRAVPDASQHRRAELWSLPTSAGGDCEDFALLKKRELVRLGVDPGRLLLATVLDRRRVPHAVLVYRSHKGDLLLDNLTDKVVNWRSSGYVFLRMQNPDSPDQWVGGFRMG
ncbi:Predicted transglutaminase-like cysteine proteinase [Lutimaribacter pacificus]|uniref:Predicted transglutaminase-like cysteine proteinase n=1 Tax=Lutimaribacter pacificus TaxID=391948 RepID=A0A1H0L9J3_9RHOB|nr:transglutaminase-like cysteine peptidase [Lutimaribacter pacificus]SDO64877.1 Predicted transglutaminase-like cysteine proteinase [Lutimaribacter pacificus]SHK69714.1 Predicted transglutaminase-like cysteine proteinase [Lutimaribacter pacificus]